MQDQEVGAALRALRLRRGWRQADVAAIAGCSHPTISRIEHGRVSELTVDRLRAAAAALDARLVLELRWRGADLPRLLDERHAALQEAFVARLARVPGWDFTVEASFSIYGERGSVDVLAWNAERAALLLVELKTELVDLQDLVATLDRKRRLAPAIGRERRWQARIVATWVVLEEGRDNRRRVAEHAGVLRHAFPATAVDMRRWMATPTESVAGLSFLTIVHRGNASRRLPPRRRVRPSARDGRALGSCLRRGEPRPDEA